MTRLWTFLGTHKCSRIVSVLACIYFTVAAIGEGRGYFSAFNSVMMFFAFWSLGYNSRKGAA